MDGYQCRQCSALSFQPNENWLGDRCRLRRACGKPFMRYKDHGSTTKDADCACMEGYHFENVDQRACVPNQKCGKGYGQGEYGVCVKCIDQHMYSSTVDRVHKCKPLTNCEKQSRCTITKSNGLVDNECGPVVRDVLSCDDPQPPPKAQTGDPTLFIIAGGVLGSILLVLCILVVIFIVRRSSLRRRRYAQKPLSPEQLDELKVKILKECEQRGDLCKKVLSKSVFMVEERIERQIWTLAQELYRSHPTQGKYEHIVEKYKESQHKYAVNGYLQEWKAWRGESKEALGELFHCLARSKRDDIVYEICNGFRHDVGFDTDMEAQLEDDEEGTFKAKHSCWDDVVEVFCPCCACCQPSSSSSSYSSSSSTSTPTNTNTKPRGEVKVKVKAAPRGKVTEKGSEASGKLLEMLQGQEPEVEVVPPAPGAIYRARPCSSAPPAMS
ncbi:uncharacterized protein LOC143302016 [Babylonia areolata]|uniref:uncharacterized protein LOC143302016 n=1 Tax=Babylonia areolata TaxID=304850 RepID=UPI003FD0B374